MKILRILGVPAAAVTVFILGCTDAPSPTGVPLPTESSESLTADSYGSPAADSSEAMAGESSESLLGDLFGLVGNVVDDLTTVTTVRRTRPVEGPATCAVETIGRRGGVMECEEAGLRVIFPRGALDEATEISIHIPDRNLVGYEFAPHGLEFDRPVQIRQSVDDTELESRLFLLRNVVVGAYVDEITPVAQALEIIPALLRGLWWWTDEVQFDIEHFSGYICATN